MEKIAPDAPIAGVILAAGSSIRMGRTKQLLPFRGRPLLEHAVDRARAGGVDGVVLVLGHRADEIRQAIRLPADVRVVVNPDHRSGQASSLRVGLEALPAEVGAAVILLGDQPEPSPETIRAAIDTYRRAGGPVVRVEYRGIPGHPVVLGRKVWEEVSRLGGDTGARTALERHPEWVVPLRVDRPPPIEVDTPEDYRALTGDDP